MAMVQGKWMDGDESGNRSAGVRRGRGGV
jgi:hypothetical protein